MRIAVATVQVPFVRGGAEILAEGLVNALQTAGHEAEIVAIPFKWYPAERILDCMLSCRLIDLTESCGQAIDRIIGLKFPAYLIAHPRKTLWLLHQHRTAYEQWDTPYSDLALQPQGARIRETIINADNKAFEESDGIFTISSNVSKRLKHFNRVESKPLYHPPLNAERFYAEEEQGYFFFPSRLTTIKRQELVLEALSQTRNPVKVLFAGKPDEPNYKERLLKVANKLRVTKQAVFLGGITESEKLKYYAQALGIVFAPFDEDYGYVTLEAMLSRKPVITCTDSGGPGEFVRHEETGLIVEPTAAAIAAAMDTLWENRSWAVALGKAGKEYYSSLSISWSNALKELLA